MAYENEWEIPRDMKFLAYELFSTKTQKIKNCTYRILEGNWTVQSFIHYFEEMVKFYEERNALFPDFILGEEITKISNNILEISAIDRNLNRYVTPRRYYVVFTNNYPYQNIYLVRLDTDSLCTIDNILPRLK